MSQPHETPLADFYRWEKQTPDHTFLRQPVSGEWISWSYREAGDEIRRIASALIALKLPKQSNVAILSKNCAHWIMADLAVMMSGHVSVPLYPTLSAAGTGYILQHSEAKAIFLGKLDDFENQREAIDASLHRISFPYYGPDAGLKWDELLQRYEPLGEDPRPAPEDLASIMYSSGTTGSPKGVMLSFNCFGFVGRQVATYFRLHTPQRFFSYLPLSHIAERALMEMVALSSGSTISFAESLDTFADNLRHEQPTVFGGVPRIFARFRSGVLEKIPGEKLERLLAIPLVGLIVRRAIVKKLGLAKAPLVVCGAAPTPVSLLEWFNKLGIEIRETYGMTENTAYSHSNFRLIKNGTVGQAWPETDVMIGDQDEILIRHQAVMLGYYRDPATTKAVFTSDGFLRTGDQGQIDAQGFLTITGRINDQFKTAKAKFVAPAPIEMVLSANADLDHVCVAGAGLPQPIALVTLSASGREKQPGELETGIVNTLDAANNNLEKHERIETAVILREPWTIENGLLTPSLKIKRKEIEKCFAARYNDWISAEKPVVWE